jgi:hypothetical protein
MIAIAEMMERLTNNLTIEGGILLKSLCVFPIDFNVRRWQRVARHEDTFACACLPGGGMRIGRSISFSVGTKRSQQAAIRRGPTGRKLAADRSAAGHVRFTPESGRECSRTARCNGP